jgi:hypothetical protein
MAKDRILLEVVVTNKGLKINQKGVDDLGASVERTNKRTKEANKTSRDFYNTQAKGVIGTANSTKSFSKLAETIGSGGRGLVGAYATLAANAFAVSAAFNALRSATQAEMVLRGLEEQGARTGRTLTVAAEKLREVVGFAISSTDAMQATAMFSATGFSSDELEQLGEVAMNSSLALGRNLPDSIDRLIKGTTKLEPELLDELGIMTKLGDATAVYALQLDKPVAALTQFERRQAFLNAVLLEGQLKFGGLSETIDANPYDKLAAAFADLTREGITFINSTLRIVDVVSFLSENSSALTGVLILFASTIKTQLLGSLSDFADRSVKAAAVTREYAEESKKLVAISTERALAEGKARVKQAANIQIASKSAAAIKKQAEAIRSGTLSVEELDKVINTNNRSLRSHNSLLERDAASGKDTAERQKTITSLQEQGRRLEGLKEATQKYNSEAVKSVQVKITAIQASAANARAQSQESMAVALQSINQNKLKASYEALILSSRQYRQALIQEAEAKGLAASQGGNLEKANYRLAISTIAIKSAINFAISGLKLLGAAFLKVIPIIGTAMIAWDMLTSAYEAGYKFLFPKTAEAQENVKEKTEALDKVLANAAKTHENYNKVLSSSIPLGARYSMAAESQANSIAEQTKALKELIDEELELRRIKEEESGSGFFSASMTRFMAGLAGQEGDYDRSLRLIEDLETKTKESSLRIGTILAKDLSGEAAKEIKDTFNSLETDLGREKLIKEMSLLGISLSALSEEDFPKVSEAAGILTTKNTALAESTRGLQEGFTLAETAITKLVSSLIPSTGYDATIESFDSIINRINEMKAAGESDLGITAQLTSMTQGLELFLDKDITKLVQSFRDADVIVQQLSSRVGNLSKAEEERLQTAKNLLASQGNYTDEIRRGLTAARAELDSKREAVALSQAQASFEQSRFSRFQAFLSAGAAGYRAQIQSEEKIRALNIAGIAANKAILDSKIAQEEVNLSKLKTELENLEKEKDSLSNIKEYNNELIKQLLFLETRGQLIEGQKFSHPDSLQDLRESGILPSSATDYTKRLLAAAKDDDINDSRAAELLTQLEAAERALVGLRLASRVLGTQIAAENIKNLTEEQKAAKGALADREAAFSRFQDNQRTLDAINSKVMAETQLSFTREGLRDSLELKIKEIEEEFKFRNKTLSDALAEEKKLVEARINDAKAMLSTANALEKKGIQEFIDIEEDRLRNLTQRTELQKAQLSAEMQLNIISQIGLDTEVKRIEALQRSTDFMTRQVDSARELSEAQFGLRSSERELQAIRGGFDRRNARGGFITQESEILRRAGLIDAAKQAAAIAESEFEFRKAILTMEFSLLEAKRKQSIDDAAEAKKRLEADIATERQKGSLADPNILRDLESQLEYSGVILRTLGASFTEEGGNMILSYGQGFNNTLENGIKALEASTEATLVRVEGALALGPRVRGGFLSQLNQARAQRSEVIAEREGPDGERVISGSIKAMDAALIELEDTISRIRPELEALGPEGSIVLAIADGVSLMTQAFVDLAETIKEGDFGSIAAAGLQAMSAAIQTVSSILRSSSDAKISNIDREIAAEQKRDGKSAESVSKLEALEKKKDSIARKQFNTNKKLMMAQAVTSTAAAIAGQLASPPVGPWNIGLAAMMGALGAAQIAVIAGTQYQSTSSSSSVQPPSTISIGRRGDTVDLARGPSASAGGEAGFIRGQQGFGSNASNFRTVGSAYGGELMRGYGNRGFVIGEKGPEVITPETPINVTPANDVMPQQPLNATFNIQALDASGVEELLVAQKGNIISMLRSAANASGEGFMESVNTTIYTRPQVNKL